MNQWATEANQKYRVVLNLERLGPFFTTTILEKRDREGNIEVGVLSDTDIIHQRTPLPPQQNISAVHGYKTGQHAKHLPPSRQYYRSVDNLM